MPEALVEGVSFADLSESEYVELMQDNLTSFMERLNFSAHDSVKLLSCLRSLMPSLGCANGAYDEKALEEVGEDDQIVANGDAAGGPEGRVLDWMEHGKTRRTGRGMRCKGWWEERRERGGLGWDETGA